MFWSRKHGARRAEVRKNRPDRWAAVLQNWRSRGVYGSIGIAAVFFVLATAIVMLRENVVPYRTGQYVPQDIRARVSFSFNDQDQLNKLRNDARESAAHVYARVNEDHWNELEKTLLDLPDRVAGLTRLDDLPPDLKVMGLSPSALSELQEMTAVHPREQYTQHVHDFMQVLRGVVIVPPDQYIDEMSSVTRPYVKVPALQAGAMSRDDIYPSPLNTGDRASPNTGESQDPGNNTGNNGVGIFAAGNSLHDAARNSSRNVQHGSAASSDGGASELGSLQGEGRQLLTRGAENLHARMQTLANRYFRNGPFTIPLDLAISHYMLSRLQPTFALDASATAQAQNDAVTAVGSDKGLAQISANEVIVSMGNTLSDTQWQELRAENNAYLQKLGRRIWKPKLGMALTVLLLTIVLSLYIGYFQPRIVRNHARAIAIAGLLLAMLLTAILSAVGKGPLYIFGVAPTILVAMILAIAYDRRFAMGIASMHGILVAIAAPPADQGIGFFLILWIGVLTCCFMLHEVRTRSKLIEVGGVTALAMIAATIASGAMMFDPIAFIINNCLCTGAAGLAVGFVVLGILPFIEKLFGITTSMTLLELADGSQPLLRRLALEAPGTYNHSLQVATLAETAAEAIGVNSLLCRVASYYHDVGKINKPDYFIENQSNGQNRHLNLSPSVSLLIIIGHVKDGLALAREYNLPPVVLPFIQQHHGTTLVEYFYHRACTLDRPQDRPHDRGGDQSQPAISEAQYRYPGPKPQRREPAIVMLADAVESATRAMSEPTASRIEALVHELAMRRLLDGQFDECDLTMRDLERVEKSLVKTLLGIYHGRIAYPSTARLSAAPSATTGPTPSVASA